MNEDQRPRTKDQELRAQGKDDYLVKFHHLAWSAVGIIAIQMVLAGIIVGEDAGLVCPSWPLCSTTGPIPVTSSLIFEMVHRFVALLLGVVVIWLLVWLLKSYRHNRAMVWTGCLGLFSLAIQIVYAGLIVLFVFPGLASTVDVMNSVIMLSLFIHLANLAKQDYQNSKTVISNELDPERRSLKPQASALYGAGMLAVLAGAIFRHSGASQALFGEDSYIRSHDQTVPPSPLVSHLLLGIHGATAGLLVIFGVWFAMASFKHKRLTKAAVLIVASIIVQGLLGIASLLSKLNLVVATLHWAMVAVIMALAAFVLSKTYLAKTDHSISGSRAPLYAPRYKGRV